jgi:hypothetical protein
MGFAEAVLLAWLIGAGVTVTFVLGYLALGGLSDHAARFVGPAIGCLYLILGPVLGLLFLPTTLTLALHWAGLDHALPIALLTTLLAGVTMLVSIRVFDELPDSFVWLAIVVVAVAVGFETVVAMLLVDGIAGLITAAVT